MSDKYQVLALKYRPYNFSELVGQKQTVKILTNSLKNKQIHNGFLFSGTRGVGKTTIARIFAKSINCEKGINDKPCDKCISCIEITKGRSIDLIELDAASNTGVDNMREILENAQYKPNRDRFKIYLIDEIHMLSNSSFNALLKTLEEPPSHVKFLMATTELQKIPITILSRCLQFNLSKIKTEEITEYLKLVMKKESVKYEDDALKKIANFGDGSMRDSLSLLDQAISFTNGNVRDKDIKNMLCLVEKTDIIKIVKLIIENKSIEIIEFVRTISHKGENLTRALNDLISIFHQISIAQILPNNKDSIDTQIYEIANKISIQDLQLYYQIAINGKKDMSYAPSEQIAFEMILLRMIAFNLENFSEKKNLKFEEEVITIKNSEDATTDKKIIEKEQKKQEVITTIKNSEDATTDKKIIANAQKEFIKNQQEWENTIKKLNFKDIPGIIVKNTIFNKFNNKKLELKLDNNFKNLLTEKTKKSIEDKLQTLFANINVIFDIESLTEGTLAQKEIIIKKNKQQELQQKYFEDENIQKLEKIFQSKVNIKSITSLK